MAEICDRCYNSLTGEGVPWVCRTCATEFDHYCNIVVTDVIELVNVG